jgi:hypothetical protein
VSFLGERTEMATAAARGTGTATATAAARGTGTDKKLELMKEVRSTSPPPRDLCLASCATRSCSSNSAGEGLPISCWILLWFAKVRAHEVAILELNNLPPSGVSPPSIPVFVLLSSLLA